MGFRAPENVVSPIGGGSNILGCHIGFSELVRGGEIDKMPRIYGIQAANCAPLHATLMAGVKDLVQVNVHPTIADGIALPRPIRVPEILKALNETNGGSVAVSEQEIISALNSLARIGLFVEPTSAAAAAGLSCLINSEIIKESETTVLLLTGTGLKASEEIGRILGLLKNG